MILNSCILKTESGLQVHKLWWKHWFIFKYVVLGKSL